MRCYDFNSGDEIGEFERGGTRLLVTTLLLTLLLLLSLCCVMRVACNKGHHGPVRSLAFTPSCSNYASGSEDGTIRIWSWAGLEEAMANVKLNGNKDDKESAIEKK